MRIVSLCPSITDSVFRLGRGAELVGRTKFCVQPVGRIEIVERVGGTKNPRLERIAELEPDVVLMNEEENRREDADTLVALGYNVVSTFARDVAGAASSLVEIGIAIHAEDEARALALAIVDRARAIHAKRRATFAYLIWQDPLMAAGPDTYLDALLTLAGGDNVASGERYPRIDAATLARAERIFLSSEPFPFAEHHRQELAALANVAISRVELVDGELLSWHGAKTLEGLDYAARLFSA